ncbi:MAG: hypothetical protein KC492_18000, partial [Myxococcales bacterium]|nr:hypothetical protein [Myxococcales bacterium]
MIHETADFAHHDEWEELLSSASVEEFVKRASGASSSHAPPPAEDLVAQFGGDLLPWLISLAEQRDDYWPWHECLVLLPRPEVFEALWEVIDPSGDTLGPLDALCLDWIWARPQLGVPLLGEQVRRKLPRAELMLKSLAQCHGVLIFRLLAAALGDSEARRILEQIGADTGLNPWGIIHTLDAGARNPETWPSQGAALTHSLRLFAARTRNDWGVLFESLELHANGFFKHYFVHGSKCLTGAYASFEPYLCELKQSPSGVDIIGSHSTLSLSLEQLSGLGVATDVDYGVPPQPVYTTLVAELLRVSPENAWIPADRALARLELGDAPTLTLVSSGFHH